MHRKAFIALLGATAITVALGACSDAADKPGGGDEKPYIALISKGFRHQFWQAVKAGAEQAAKEFNVTVTFEGAQEEGNVEQQIQLLQTVIDKKPDAIGFAAIDSQAAGPLMQQAKNDKIPVIAFDSGVDSDVPITTAATNNLAAAAEAAKHMAEKIGHEGKIAMVVHDQTSVTGVQRRDGFVDYMKKNEPKIQIVDTQYSGDPLKATDLAKAIITANPDLKGIYGSNEGAAIGVLHAVQERGLTGKMTVVGFDSGKDQIDAIKAGTMAGAITQNPVGIGYETVKAAVAAIKGETLPKTVDTGFYWYDKANIDDPKISAVLYQ
ncbi:ABC transporter substrate-binding protein [Dactylosporangium sucinum]|uniref:LacI family transcriptional regulator n=1 Tax=Dactylosporangium sucinum TaxID=1424081 RepID=A0A917WZY6_9ACTN|nr:ABC transporter substrate-binding protein [Dactylosporangium sucinum]GGM44711.1 LacI family transcriptional regulator [Dactylosporangium sucinum]